MATLRQRHKRTMKADSPRTWPNGRRRSPALPFPAPLISR